MKEPNTSLRRFIVPAVICFPLLSSFSGCATPLARAARKGDTRKVISLLGKGAKVNEVSIGVGETERVTPLHAAAIEGHADTAKALIARGADVNVLTVGIYDFITPETPLMKAAYNGHLDVVKVLIDNGADINAKSKVGSALFLATYKGHADVVRLLLENGAIPDQYTVNWAEKNGPSIIPQMLKRAMGQEVPKPGRLAPASTVASDVDTPRRRFAENAKDFAVVVGVEKYSNDLPEAQFAERDAQAVKNHLLALGVPERNIKYLVGSRASKSSLEAFLKDWLPKNVKDDSRVFFYFSGHGAPNPESGQAYLVPWDGNPNFLERTAYPVKRLYADLGALKAKQVIVALDACFSGAGGRSVLAKGTRPLVNKVDMEVAPNGKLVLFAAASAKETTSTLEDQGHGIFTYFFLKGLGGEAKNQSGAITMRGLYDYLKPKVQDAASRQNRDQTPMLEGAGQDAELVRFQ